VTLRGVRTTGAFGLFDRPLPETGERLRKALCKAKELALLQSTPTTRKFPLSALRRHISNILGLDVIFSPRLKEAFKTSSNPKARVSTYKTWEVSPVWRTAPKGAVKKAMMLSELLHVVATDGWKVSNIVHDLVRLAIIVWQCSMKNFNGLYRQILSKIYKASQSGAQNKSPDPLLQFSLLSSNPIANYYSVSRFENRKRPKLAKMLGLTHLPLNLGLRANLLCTNWYEAHVRRRGHAPSC